MTKYQLAKLVMMAGTLETRKRVQKMVYMLQAAGMALDAEFRLHHYGPYSADVADLLNQMTRDGILVEKLRPNMAGKQYEYTLDEGSRSSLVEYEGTETGKSAAQEFEKYEQKIRELIDTSVADLELSSTILFYRRAGAEWSDAVQQACVFKSKSEDGELTKQALALAHNIMA